MCFVTWLANIHARGTCLAASRLDLIVHRRYTNVSPRDTHKTTRGVVNPKVRTSTPKQTSGNGPNGHDAMFYISGERDTRKFPWFLY